MLSRRGLMVLWLACVASVDDEACALQKALGKPKIRDNFVYFYGYLEECTVQRVEFNETSHSITQGQPYEGVFTRGTYLDVRAGRHGSEEVAHDFNAGILPDNALGLSASAGLPSELNFAVFGTMSVAIDGATRACSEMRIAQGHRGTKNNWWIAGTKCYSIYDVGVLRCPCGHTNQQLSSIFVKASRFATHCAESAGHPYLRCWKRTCVLWKTKGPATKTPYWFLTGNNDFN